MRLFYRDLRYSHRIVTAVRSCRFPGVMLLFLCVVFYFSEYGVASWPKFPLSAECSSGSAMGNQSSASVSRGAQNLLVVWVDKRISTRKDIFCTRMSPSGELLDPIGIPVCTTSAIQNWVNAPGGEQVYLVVWTDNRNGNYGIYGARRCGCM
jgi:hypothetical protein